MAKRSKMAIEYKWPKMVEIRRLQDRVYKMLERNPWMMSDYHISTPLHCPRYCVLDVEMAYSTLINVIKECKLDVFVSPSGDDMVRVYIIWPDFR